MANTILCIETSCDICSVAIVCNGQVVNESICNEPRKQASQLAPMVKELMDKASLSFSNLAAVAVSIGPGSYTGLRTGLSTAKGICFATGLPLIGINTLDILAHRVLSSTAGAKADYVVPMIDARRMEVYQALYQNKNGQLERMDEIAPKILEPESYKELLQSQKVMFSGNGAAKFSNVIASQNAIFDQTPPTASQMAVLAQNALDKGLFEDVAYSEPFYLKEFIAGAPKKLL
ncbi:MAG: tRNA (adenosine(37)-N6)-threonylcarbamoyltransferase complex dimerization subunit type 1 TsaB [Bacteroidales bacterium]|nr:tRNA (adenosine(37)-N6)-threonylcarbamoyltransferase complex dimerization subunit type 1 TsaB [Bacteroidales bacterium]